MKTVQSTQNPLVKKALALQAKPHLSRTTGEILVEGEKLIGEALASGAKVLGLFLTDPEAIRAEWQVPEERLCQIPAGLMKKITSLETPPKAAAILALAASRSLQDLLPQCRTLVVLDRIQDPGNLGTIIRTCEGLAADGVILTKGSCSLWNQKVQRAAMGSLFRVPCLEGITNAEVGTLLTGHGFTLIGTSAQGSPMTMISPPPLTALVFGNEGSGLHPALGEQCRVLVSIPIRPPVESLNISAAVAIFLYERLRGLQIPRLRVPLPEIPA